MIMTFIIKLYLFLLMALFLISKSLRIMRGSLFIVFKIKHKNLIILNFFRGLNKIDLWFLFYEVIFFVTFSVLFYQLNHLSPKNFSLAIFMFLILPNTIIDILYYRFFVKIKLLLIFSLVTFFLGFIYIFQ